MLAERHSEDWFLLHHPGLIVRHVAPLLNNYPRFLLYLGAKMLDQHGATARLIAEMLIDGARGISRQEFERMAHHALHRALPAEIVAITQYMPPELRPLMPRHHLN